jgi:hypothetical protein
MLLGVCVCTVVFMGGEQSGAPLGAKHGEIGESEEQRAFPHFPTSHLMPVYKSIQSSVVTLLFCED